MGRYDIISLKQETDLKMMEILRILNSKNEVLGAKVISEELVKKGYSIGERAVRYHMRILDEKGFTEKIGYSGRQITDKGIEELHKGLIYDQVDFTYSLFEEKMYNVSLDLTNQSGLVIVNISSINDLESKEIIKDVFKKGLAVSKNVNIYEKDNKTFIETVCGNTIDGVFQQNGIISRPLCGGLVRVEDYKPINVIEEIAYEKTSLTPLEAFTGHDNTSVLDVAETGTGVIPANFRLIPSIKKDKAESILESLKKIGIGGVIQIGDDGEDILGVDVPENSIGISIIGGVTPLCAAHEYGYDINIKLADSYAEYDKMDEVEYNTKPILKPASKKPTNKIVLILDKVFNLISGVDFDPETSKGKILANISYVDKENLDETVELLNQMYKNKPEYCIGNKYSVIKGSNNKFGIATICSLTMDGILTNQGIRSEPLYSGLLDIEEKTKRFIELIAYTGSSVDPHEIFIKKDMHDISGALNNYGKILASVHSVPYVAREQTLDILDLIKDDGFQSLYVGKPNEHIFNAKVDMYHFGYVTTGGLNPIALIKENDILVETKSIETLMDFDSFETL